MKIETIYKSAEREAMFTPTCSFELHFERTSEINRSITAFVRLYSGDCFPTLRLERTRSRVASKSGICPEVKSCGRAEPLWVICCCSSFDCGVLRFRPPPDDSCNPCCCLREEFSCLRRWTPPTVLSPLLSDAAIHYVAQGWLIGLLGRLAQ